MEKPYRRLEDLGVLRGLVGHPGLLGRIAVPDDPDVALGAVAPAGAFKPERIIEADRIVPGIRVEVDAPRQPDGILGQRGTRPLSALPAAQQSGIGWPLARTTRRA